MRCSTISSIRTRFTGASPAISSSWRCSAACARSGDRCLAPQFSSCCRIISPARRRTGCLSSACSLCWSCCSSHAVCSASSAGGPWHEPASRRKCLEDFRQSRRREQRLHGGRGRRTARHHRPERRRQTTFFNLISGFFTPTSGRIIFDGEDITALRPARRVWRGMARTFQITEVFPELPVRENLRVAVEVAAGNRLNPWLSRDADREIRGRIVELMDMGGLTEKADRLVGELAHGDQRATEMMMALALRPRLLLLDEPTAGMGDQETYDITQLIRKLHREEKLAIVLIEHDMRVVFHLADRIMVLAEGEPLAEGTPREIGANEAVQAAYLGKAAA